MESLPRCPWIFLQISFLDRKWILTTDLRKQSTLSDGKRVMIASLCLLAPVVHLQPVCTVCKCCNSACCYCAELHPNHSFANFCFWHFLAKKVYMGVEFVFLDLIAWLFSDVFIPHLGISKTINFNHFFVWMVP